MVLQYLINMDDCSIVPRTPETDQHINCKPISKEIVKMIMAGEVTAKEVVNAIGAKLRDDPDFDFNEYNNELKKLNVRRSNRQARPAEVELKNREEEMISIDEINAEKVKAKAKVEKKARVKKIKEALDAEPAAVDPLAGL